MAVITTLSAAQIDRILCAYGTHALRVEPIAEGTTNTLYRVHTTRGRLVLRLSERSGEEDVLRELDVLRRLAGCQVPVVIPPQAGGPLRWARDKPVVLFQELPGATVPRSALSLSQLGAIGRWMAQAHAVEAPDGLPLTPYHPGTLWARHYLPLREPLQALHPEIGAAFERLHAEEDVAAAFQALPQAIVHGDLFADNLIFDRDQGPWVIDFEIAGRGPRLFDLAVAVFALAYDEQRGAYAPERAQALIRGWSTLRAATSEELRRWDLALRMATLRFAFTRARDFSLRPASPALQGARDPREALQQLKAQEGLRGMLGA